MFESLNSISPHAKSGAVRGARGERRPALAGVSRSADGRRGGRAGLQRADLERRDRAGRPAAADRREAQRRGQPRDQTPAFIARFGSIGDEPAGGTPEEFGATIARDLAKWDDVVKRSGAKLD